MPTSNKDITKWSNRDLYTRIVDTFGMPHVKRRYKQEEEASKYTIPYIPEKEVMLTTGRYNTGKISTNLLDSIYDSSKRTGVPLDIALGLAGRESTLGIGRGFKEGQDVTATDLYSNWQQIQQPATKSQVDKWNNTVKKEKRGEALTENDYADRNDFLIGEQQRLEQHKPITEHPIDNALKFYQTGKYNPGDKNHSKMVEEDGKLLMSDPAIQKWLKTKTGTQMKCGGRRKAQLGLDIREGGIAIPIANNMYYMDGRSHDNGGIAIGPNNKNGLEVEGGEVVKVGKNDVKVFSSVPLLRGASPAELVLGGANPDAVFKAQEEFKDRNRINDDGTTYEMGGEGKPKSKRSHPVTGVLPYGYTIRNLYSVENPYRKGIKGNVAKMYDSRTLGAGVDVVSGHPELYKKAKSGKMTKKQADEIAVIHLRKDDNAIRSNYADVYGKAAADTLSYGPRFLVAQARYQQGNVRKAWQPIHKAMAKGDAKALKKAVLQVTPKDHEYRRKWIEDFKVYKMGGMIYEINGNVRNGLSLRHKAKYGTIDKKDKDVKVGQDGLIYKRAADGEWYTDGTVHVAFKKATPNGLIKPSLSSAKKFNYTAPEPKRVYIDHSDYEEEKETKKIGSLTYEKNKDDKWVPASKQSTTTTRDGGRPKDFGMTRTGVNHPNGNYKYHPLTGEKISEMGVVETSEPSVKGATKISSKSSSTARGRGSKVASSASSRDTAKVESPKPATAINPMEARYASRVQKGQAQEVTPKPVVEYNEAADKNPDKNRYTRAAGFKNGNTSASSGNNQKEKDDKKDKDGRWIGQYKPVRTEDWIGLGSNLIGSVASYFMTKNAINKMPDPVKPVMAQAAKLKTRYNIEPQLSNVTEAEQMNRASVRRNTQSSNTSLAREQRLMNEARGSRNTLYGQKENIETQLINQDKLNRQTVYQKNVDTYNNYLNRIYLDKQHKAESRISNINNLIGGLTGSVNNMLNTIESRRTTNNTLRAIAAANPNVDARLIGGFDYYEGIGPDGKRKALYDKHQRFVRYI